MALRPSLLLILVAVGIGVALATVHQSGSPSAAHPQQSRVTASRTCADWLDSPTAARVAYVRAGTNPTVSRAFAKIAEQYGSALCDGAPKSRIPTAEQMVNLATASGHTDLYG